VTRVRSNRVESSRIGRLRRVPPDTRYASLINVIIKNVAIRSRRISSGVTRDAHRARISQIGEIWRQSLSSFRFPPPHPFLPDSTERTGRFFDARHLFFATACDGNRRRTCVRRVYRQVIGPIIAFGDCRYADEKDTKTTGKKRLIILLSPPLAPRVQDLHRMPGMIMTTMMMCMRVCELNKPRCHFQWIDDRLLGRGGRSRFLESEIGLHRDKLAARAELRG